MSVLQLMAIFHSRGYSGHRLYRYDGKWNVNCGAKLRVKAFIKVLRWFSQCTSLYVIVSFGTFVTVNIGKLWPVIRNSSPLGKNPSKLETRNTFLLQTIMYHNSNLIIS